MAYLFEIFCWVVLGAVSHGGWARTLQAAAKTTSGKFDMGDLLQVNTHMVSAVKLIHAGKLVCKG